MKKVLLCLSALLILNSIDTFAKDNSSKIKTAIYTNNAPKPIGSYSQAIQAGNTIYISGQIPIDPKTGELMQGDLKDQVKLVFTNLSEITKAANGNLDNM